MKVVLTHCRVVRRQSIGGAHIVVVGLPARGWFRQCAFGFSPIYVGSKDSGDRARKFDLKREYVLELAIVALGPTVGAIYSIEELCRNADAIAIAANTTLEHVADTQLVGHLANIGRLAFVPKGRVAGDDKQRGEPRQLGDDVFGDAITEVFLARIAAHVGERQDRN